MSFPSHLPGQLTNRGERLNCRRRRPSQQKRAASRDNVGPEIYKQPWIENSAV